MSNSSWDDIINQGREKARIHREKTMERLSKSSQATAAQFLKYLQRKALIEGLTVIFRPTKKNMGLIIHFLKREDYYMERVAETPMAFLDLVMDNWGDFTASNKNFWGASVVVFNFEKLLLSSACLSSVKEFFIESADVLNKRKMRHDSNEKDPESYSREGNIKVVWNE